MHGSCTLPRNSATCVLNVPCNGLSTKAEGREGRREKRGGRVRERKRVQNQRLCDGARGTPVLWGPDAGGGRAVHPGGLVAPGGERRRNPCPQLLVRLRFLPPAERPVSKPHGPLLRPPRRAGPRPLPGRVPAGVPAARPRPSSAGRGVPRRVPARTLEGSNRRVRSFDFPCGRRCSARGSVPRLKLAAVLPDVAACGRSWHLFMSQ